MNTKPLIADDNSVNSLTAFSCQGAPTPWANDPWGHYAEAVNSQINGAGVLLYTA
jgi:hypothetical protein